LAPSPNEKLKILNFVVRRGLGTVVTVKFDQLYNRKNKKYDLSIEKIIGDGDSRKVEMKTISDMDFKDSQLKFPFKGIGNLSIERNMFVNY
jgi:hypothetical protein